MRLSEFCDNGIYKPVLIEGLSAHFVKGEVPPTPEQWCNTRVQIVVSRKFMILDAPLSDLFQYKLSPFVLIPGQVFETLSSDPSVVFYLDFEACELSPREVLDYFANLQYPLPWQVSQTRLS